MATRSRLVKRTRACVSLAAWCALLLAAANPGAALAAESEARSAALAANCTPKKLQELRHLAGRRADTVYRVDCSDRKDLFVVVECSLRQCLVVR